MTNEYNNAYRATYTQFCSTFGSKNKESSNSKLHGGACGGSSRELKKKGKSDSLFPANPRDFLSTQNNGEN